MVAEQRRGIAWALVSPSNAVRTSMKTAVAQHGSVYSCEAPAWEPTGELAMGAFRAGSPVQIGNSYDYINTCAKKKREINVCVCVCENPVHL